MSLGTFSIDRFACIYLLYDKILNFYFYISNLIVNSLVLNFHFKKSGFETFSLTSYVFKFLEVTLVLCLMRMVFIPLSKNGHFETWVSVFRP